jgi:hypothetical protein
MMSDTYHSSACPTDISQHVADALRSLAGDVDLFPLLSRNDQRLIAIFEAILHGASGELDVLDRLVIERLGATMLLAAPNAT